MKQEGSILPNPINFSIQDYPHLGKLINGQDVVLRMKIRAGHKTLTGQGEYINIQPDSIDIEEPQVKPTVQEILLASINDSLSRQSVAIP